MRKQFSEDFAWGVSSASYQIEGAVKEDGRGESIWDRFSHMPGRVRNDDTGDVAVDFYHRYKEDIRLLGQLGIPYFRLSIAWPRIFPADERQVNEKGLAFYEEVLRELRAQGICAVVTLYHWDLPQWAQDRGGWANREIIGWFGRFCRTVMERLDGLVEKWITINEPWVACFEGYYTGNFAPGIRDFSTALLSAHHMLCAHGEAVRIFRSGGYRGEIGITLNLSPKHPATDSKADEAAARRRDGYANRWFLDPLYQKGYPEDMLAWYQAQGVVLPAVLPDDMACIAAQTDFLGVNYYNIDMTRACEGEWPLGFTQGGHVLPNTVYDWPVTEWGLKELLKRLTDDYGIRALYVTENGLSAKDNVQLNGRVDDYGRIDYLARHIGACHDAIEEGVPLKGYFVWTLLDNFEWNTGYFNQFGLVHVDRRTQVRTIKQSGYWYADVIGKNALEI